MGNHRRRDRSRMVYAYIWCVAITYNLGGPHSFHHIGLGCRSGSTLLYGTLATLVWAMLVFSSILAYHSTRMSLDKRSAHVSRFLSILLRRMGKFIATINAIWLVLTSMFQFSNFFDRCWCNSSVLGLQGAAYTVIDFSHFDLTGMRAAWIYGVVLAAATAFIFILSVNFLAPARVRDAGSQFLNSRKPTLK